MRRACHLRLPLGPAASSRPALRPPIASPLLGGRRLAPRRAGTGIAPATWRAAARRRRRGGGARARAASSGAPVQGPPGCLGLALAGGGGAAADGPDPARHGPRAVDLRRLRRLPAGCHAVAAHASTPSPQAAAGGRRCRAACWSMSGAARGGSRGFFASPYAAWPGEDPRAAHRPTRRAADWAGGAGGPRRRLARRLRRATRRR